MFRWFLDCYIWSFAEQSIRSTTSSLLGVSKDLSSTQVSSLIGLPTANMMMLRTQKQERQALSSGGVWKLNRKKIRYVALVSGVRFVHSYGLSPYPTALPYLCYLPPERNFVISIKPEDFHLVIHLSDCSPVARVVVTWKEVVAFQGQETLIRAGLALSASNFWLHLCRETLICTKAFLVFCFF